MRRRAAHTCLVLLLSGGAAHAQTPSIGEPRDVVVSLYKLAARDLKGPEPSSPFYDDAARKMYFSKDFDRQIDTAEAQAAKDGSEFFDFDPISSSQDSELKNVSIQTVLTQASRAIVSAHFENHGQKAAVTYTIVAEDGAWKIDDIAGTADKMPWSVRNLLAENAKP